MSNFTAVALAVASFLTAAICLVSLAWVLVFARRNARLAAAAPLAGTGGATAASVLAAEGLLADAPQPAATRDDEADEPTHPNLRG